MLLEGSLFTMATAGSASLVVSLVKNVVSRAQMLTLTAVCILTVMWKIQVTKDNIQL